MIGLNRRRIMGNVTSAFPSGYTRLQYVDNQGAAYCNTGIPISGDMIFDANIYKYQNYSNAHYSILGGGLNPNQTRNSVGLKLNPSNKLDTIYRLNNSTGVPISLNKWFNISLKQDGFYNEDVVIQNITRTSFTSSYYFYLGGYASYLANPVSLSPAFLYIGDCKVNNVDFIPAKRNSDDAVGFLRMSDDVFLTSESGTPFLAGPNY